MPAMTKISALQFLSERYVMFIVCMCVCMYVAHLSHNGWFVVCNNQQRLRDTCSRKKVVFVCT